MEERRIRLTPASEIAQGTGRMTAPGEWGPWSLVRSNYTLIHHNYEIDLETCTSSAEVLDWIAQIAGKRWADDSTIAHLVRALDDLLYLQSNLCPCGADKRLTSKQIRDRVDHWTFRVDNWDVLPDRAGNGR